MVLLECEPAPLSQSNVNTKNTNLLDSHSQLKSTMTYLWSQSTVSALVQFCQEECQAAWLGKLVWLFFTPQRPNQKHNTALLLIPFLVVLFSSSMSVLDISVMSFHNSRKLTAKFLSFTTAQRKGQKSLSKGIWIYNCIVSETLISSLYPYKQSCEHELLRFLMYSLYMQLLSAHLVYYLHICIRRLFVDAVGFFLKASLVFLTPLNLWLLPVPFKFHVNLSVKKLHTLQCKLLPP